MIRRNSNITDKCYQYVGKDFLQNLSIGIIFSNNSVIDLAIAGSSKYWNILLAISIIVAVM